MKFILSGRIILAHVGGLSGLELDAKGQRGLAVSDRGAVYDLQLFRRDGVLQRAEFRPWSLHRNLPGDIEGLATLDFNDVYFSYEKPGHIQKIRKNGVINRLPSHPDFPKMQHNYELEALAIDAHGALYTLPEGSMNDINFPLYKFENNRWKLFTQIKKRGAFMAVGADFGPDGLFYLLERAVSPMGFLTRIRRFDLNATDLDEQTLLTTWPWQYDNLEAISIWRDPAGLIRATLLSDDNFLRIQQSEIAEFILR